jgi:hypothetical protein
MTQGRHKAALLLSSNIWKGACFGKYHCAPPACSALNVANKPTGQLPGLLPDILVGECRINAPRARLLVKPARNRCLTTAFHSPATAAPFEATITGSKIPACRVSPAPDFPETRSAYCATSPAVTGRVGIIAASPLLRSDPALPASPRLPLPFRAFTRPD